LSLGGAGKRVSNTYYSLGGHATCPGPHRSVTFVPPAFDDSLLQIFHWPVYANITDHCLRAIYQYPSTYPCLKGEPGNLLVPILICWFSEAYKGYASAPRGNQSEVAQPMFAALLSHQHSFRYYVITGKDPKGIG